MKPRIYLDEDVNPELAVLLRGQGFDAISAHEVGALTISDEEQLMRAVADDRAIITYDYKDFLRLAEDWTAAGKHHAGIVISYRQYDWNQIRPLHRTTLRLLGAFTAEALRGTLQVLDDYRSARGADEELGDA